MSWLGQNWCNADNPLILMVPDPVGVCADTEPSARDVRHPTLVGIRVGHGVPDEEARHGDPEKLSATRVKGSSGRAARMQPTNASTDDGAPG